MYYRSSVNSDGEANNAYLYQNGVQLEETWFWSYSMEKDAKGNYISGNVEGTTGGRDVTLEAEQGDTFSLRATRLDGTLGDIITCFEYDA